MKMDQIVRFKEFLFDPAQREIELQNYSSKDFLLKRSVADGLDALYIGDDYGFYRSLTGKLDFAGLVHYDGHVVYDLWYTMRDHITDKARINDLFDSIAEQVEIEVLRRYAANDLPEPTDKSKTLTHDAEYFRENLLESQVWAAYVEDRPKKWWSVNREYIVNTLFARYVDCILNRSKAVAEATKQYLSYYANFLRQWKQEDELCNKRFDELAATPGRHRYQRAIRNSIHDEGKVWIDVWKDGFAFTSRIEARVLTLSHNNSYYLHYMSTKDQKRFCNQFGSYDAKLYPEDIVAIRHGRRTLYSKADIDAQEESK